jgi:hypothetical protein
MSIKYLVNVDLVRNQLLNARVQNLSSAPATPDEGLIYYDTVAKFLYFYDGTSWVAAAGGSATTLNGQNGAYYLARTNHTGTQAASTISDLATVVKAYRLHEFAVPTSSVAFNAQKLTGLADPVDAQDAATKAYVLAQVASLVDAAPGVLDTLNELAAALGDDPNFATTVATGIANAKARANHTGTQLASTISDFSTAADARITAREYVANVGDGSATSVNVDHNLNTRDVIVQLRQVASPYAVVYADIEMNTVNRVVLTFATAPTTGQYRVLITKVG